MYHLTSSPFNAVVRASFLSVLIKRISMAALHFQTALIDTESLSKVCCHYFGFDSVPFRAERNALWAHTPLTRGTSATLHRSVCLRGGINRHSRRSLHAMPRFGNHSGHAHSDHRRHCINSPERINARTQREAPADPNGAVGASLWRYDSVVSGCFSVPSIMQRSVIVLC